MGAGHSLKDPLSRKKRLSGMAFIIYLRGYGIKAHHAANFNFREIIPKLQHS